MRAVWIFALLISAACTAEEPQAALRDEAKQALKRAVAFFREKVAHHGGYVYYVSEDFSQRWGEGQFGADTIFVQPPGTPAVGLAFLEAYQATGDACCLDAAREAAVALCYGQLQSGGWTQTIHFGPAKRLGQYRNGKGGDWNVSSLDDGQTQTALRFLIRADEAFEFKHEQIHEAVAYGLAALLKAQFPNGGFPQVWRAPVDSKPLVKARYPDYDWKTEGRIKNYWDHYTLNDGLAGEVAETLIAAHQVYRETKYKDALAKLGDFLVLAQMPDPQPAWCQQYNYEMIPMWARKFEPPAITGGESQDAMRTLIRIARYSGEKKYLDPIGPALAYLKQSLLPDGRAARYYELRTNKPLYMDKEYRLTYDDGAAPSHYGWKVPARLEKIERAWQAALKDEPEPEPHGQPSSKDLEDKVRRIVKDLDAQGRWVSVYAGESLTGQPKFVEGLRYISSAVFCRNVGLLSDYLR